MHGLFDWFWWLLGWDRLACGCWVDTVFREIRYCERHAPPSGESD